MQRRDETIRWTPAELIDTFHTASYLLGDFDQDGFPDSFTMRTEYVGPNEYVGVMEFWRYLAGHWSLFWHRKGKLEDYEIPIWTPSRHYLLLNLGILGTDNVPKIMIADGRSIAVLKYVAATQGNVIKDGFSISGWHWKTVEGWKLRLDDQWFAADIDGDHRNEIFVANGRYFGVLREINNSQLTMTWFAVDKIEGWNLRSGDIWQAEDIDGDGRDELLVTHGGYRAVLRHSGDGDALTITNFEHQ